MFSEDLIYAKLNWIFSNHYTQIRCQNRACGLNRLRQKRVAPKRVNTEHSVRIPFSYLFTAQETNSIQRVNHCHHAFPAPSFLTELWWNWSIFDEWQLTPNLTSLARRIHRMRTHTRIAKGKTKLLFPSVIQSIKMLWMVMSINSPGDNNISIGDQANRSRRIYIEALFVFENQHVSSGKVLSFPQKWPNWVLMSNRWTHYE